MKIGACFAVVSDTFGELGVFRLDTINEDGLFGFGCFIDYLGNYYFEACCMPKDYFVISEEEYYFFIKKGLQANNLDVLKII